MSASAAAATLMLSFVGADREETLTRMGLLFVALIGVYPSRAVNG